MPTRWEHGHDLLVEDLSDDGPFSEAKEVIGGFAIYEVPSKQRRSSGRGGSCSCISSIWKGWEEK